MYDKGRAKHIRTAKNSHYVRIDKKKHEENQLLCNGNGISNDINIQATNRRKVRTIPYIEYYNKRV